MFRKLAGQPLKSFAWDVMAIVVGLTFTFLIDEWRSDKKLQREEFSILKSISEELKADIVFAEEKLEFLVQRKNDKKKLLDHAFYGQPDSLNSVIGSRLLNYQGFFPNNSTYVSISAELRHFISRDSLRINLQEYYGRDYGNYQDFADYDKQLAVERLQFLRKKIVVDTVKTIDYRNMSLKDIDQLKMYPSLHWNMKSLTDESIWDEFKNHVYWSLHSDNITMYFYKHRIEKAQELLRQINEILEE